VKAPLPPESIALITYEPDAGDRVGDAGLKYASGFFIETAAHGKVCVTCAHVLKDHPGPNKKIFYVNGVETKVCFDAWPCFGVDVALLEVPPELLTDGLLYYHKLGASQPVNGIYYTHAWSEFRPQAGAVEFNKVWGPRLVDAHQKQVRRGARTYGTWILRNDRFDPASGRSFSRKNFAPGWSGSPVFNVRERLEDHRVIGVLSIVAQEEGEAHAISIERLDFLQPVEPQIREGWLGRAPEPPWKRLASRLRLASAKPQYVIRYDEDPQERQLFNMRYTQITGQPVCPPIPEPISLYDVSG
jgi:hypothetical protein